MSDARTSPAPQAGTRHWRGAVAGRARRAGRAGGRHRAAGVTELWDWTLGPGERHSSPAHTAGTREQLLVLDGRVEVRVGPRAEVLAGGDSASFAGDLPHGYANASKEQVARFALTVFEPGVGPGSRSEATDA